jgi:hypothetical protein
MAFATAMATGRCFTIIHFPSCGRTHYLFLNALTIVMAVDATCTALTTAVKMIGNIRVTSFSFVYLPFYITSERYRGSMTEVLGVLKLE